MYRRISMIAIFTFGLLLLNIVANGQQTTINGTVSDPSGNSLPGVNIKVKGTTTGTATDANGQYELTVESLQDTLVFSYIGFQTQEIPIKGKTVINITLQSQAITGEELVVVGYGAQQKSDLTGSIGIVEGENLEKRPATNITQSLAGKVAGVDVTLNSGRPGGRPNIKIRGTTSISNTNKPLYVIDGVIMPSGSSMEFIDPGDIKSLQVLKDASATAIYGARGANGVVLITTERGSRDGGRVTYNAHVSVGRLQHEIKTLNSKNFLKVEGIAYQNAQKYDSVGWANGDYQDPTLKRTDPRLFDENGNPLYDTDWQKEATQNAITNDQHISFSNGDANNSYRISVGYHNEDGLLKESRLKRYTGRFDIYSQINNWLTAGGFINYNFQDEKRDNGSWVGRQLYESIPISPVKFPDGTWAGNAVYPGMEGGPNLLRYLKEDIHKYNTKNAIANAHININLIKGVEFKSKLSTTIFDQRNDNYGGRELAYNSADQNGIASINNAQRTTWEFENQVTYTGNFAKIHHVKVLAGASWENENYFSTNMETQSFNSDFFKFNNLGAGSNPQPSSSGKSAYALNSYFARVNYTLKDRYLLTITGREDGSSKFGKNNQYAFFPSGALGWRISEEDFMRNLPFISNLKIRASYGVTGNSAITPYQALAGLTNYTYILNGGLAKGVGINTLANPNLKWEKNKQLDIGIELGLFADRISLEADVYRRKSEDMLLNAPVPTSSGFSSVTRNVGNMENRGIELNLRTTNIDKNDFSWHTDFNISVNRNKVLRLSGGSDIIRRPTIIRQGEPVNSFYGFVRLGTWNTDQAKEAAQFGKLPGDLRYKDINNDGQINQDDRVIIGDGIADGYGSLTNTFNYKNFDLTLGLQFSYGKDVYLEPITFEDRVGIANSLSTVLNAWTPDHQNTPIQQLRPLAAGYSTVFPDADSHGIHNASYIRGSNIQLAYNFSPSIINKLKIRNLRVYASMQNFFLLEDSSLKDITYDPGLTSPGEGGDLAQGTTNYTGQYPRPEVFTIGLKLSL